MSTHTCTHAHTPNTHARMHVHVHTCTHLRGRKQRHTHLGLVAADVPQVDEAAVHGQGHSHWPSPRLIARSGLLLHSLGDVRG